MEKIHTSLTVLFEDPFWIGLFERQYKNRYEVCKVTFGSEPKDAEVYEFVLKNLARLRFSPPVRAEGISDRQINPKRMQRLIHRQMRSEGSVGTKAQIALKAQYEQAKGEKKAEKKDRREQESERQYLIRCEKRKEKRRGH